MGQPLRAGKPSLERTARQHFTQFVNQYQLTTLLQFDVIPYIDQVLTYLSIEMAANIATNVQEHFAQQTKILVTTLVVKRRVQQTPIQEARSSARRISNVILYGNDAGNLNPAELAMVRRITDYIRLPDINVSVAYDVNVDALKVCLTLNLS